ncbi:hypothetical protein [Xanthomonas sp. XNM01]|uniref:hypothetical protein n=1 Tax=Xanthomonas sp. XNM01 TaxID=2769289 RepID=UPI001CE15B02|nr:hypothetical protein [Xanthomonas sp. XNM01]
MTEAVLHSMDHTTRPVTRATMVDVDSEQQHWRDAWRTLPRASAIRSFKRYWPVLQAGYDVYLQHPHAPATDILERFLVREAVVASPLTGRDAEMVFRQIWQRITG